MSDGILSKAATMEIPISSNGDTSSLPEDDGLEQVRGLGAPWGCLGLYQGRAVSASQPPVLLCPPGPAAGDGVRTQSE